MTSTAFLSPPPEAPVLDLGAARSARAAEAERRAASRAIVLAVSLVAVLPPGADLGEAPEADILDAADLVDDPGRLGEIARALVARAEAARSPIHTVKEN